MNRMFLEKLEFNKILDILSNYCITEFGKKLAIDLCPSYDKSTVYNLLSETSEASSLVYKKNEPPILPFYELKNIYNILEINGILSTKYLKY